MKQLVKIIKGSSERVWWRRKRVRWWRRKKLTEREKTLAMLEEFLLKMENQK